MITLRTTIIVAFLTYENEAAYDVVSMTDNRCSVDITEFGLWSFGLRPPSSTLKTRSDACNGVRYPTALQCVIREPGNLLIKMHIDEMKLTENVVRNFRVAKIFRENTDKITSIDFSSNGETLISSSDDDSIVIYDCQGGT